MDYQQLFDTCSFGLATPEKIVACEPFSCGGTEDDRDLNEFFTKDAIGYHNRLLGKTYFFCLKDNPNKIVTAFTVSYEGIKLTNRLAEEYQQQFLDDTNLRDKDIKRFPGVLLGRLGTDQQFSGQGYGSAVMDFIKAFFLTNVKAGCRFIIVDALNNERTLSYYKRNDFKFLIEDERLEAKYVGVGVGRLPLHTRLMYFDLLTLKVNSE